MLDSTICTLNSLSGEILARLFPKYVYFVLSRQALKKKRRELEVHAQWDAWWKFTWTRNFSRLRRLSFLFMGNMSPYYFKTIFRLCMKCMPSFIKIGGAVSEKNGDIGQTFVVLYIGFLSETQKRASYWNR